ncbi:MAG TPA: hypothetical protein VML50_13530 [Anaeromyxobacter sp.]|nr:hypothetical protein [Anaeromyxobacter sp.]
MRDTRTKISDAVVTRPATFEVAGHQVVVARIMERRWTVTVDSHRLDATYDTQAEAWEAGVRDVQLRSGLPGA